MVGGAGRVSLVPFGGDAGEDVFGDRDGRGDEEGVRPLSSEEADDSAISSSGDGLRKRGTGRGAGAATGGTGSIELSSIGVEEHDVPERRTTAQVVGNLLPASDLASSSSRHAVATTTTPPSNDVYAVTK